MSLLFGGPLLTIGPYYGPGPVITQKSSPKLINWPDSCDDWADYPEEKINWSKLQTAPFRLWLAKFCSF